MKDVPAFVTVALRAPASSFDHNHTKGPHGPTGGPSRSQKGTVFPMNDPTTMVDHEPEDLTVEAVQE